MDIQPGIHTVASVSIPLVVCWQHWVNGHHQTLTGQKQDNNVRVPYKTYINDPHKFRIKQMNDHITLILCICWKVLNMFKNQNLPQDKTDTNEYHWTRTALSVYETDDNAISELIFLSVCCTSVRLV